METVNCSYSKMVDVHKLVVNPKNPNKHPDKQIEMLAKIIDYQGMRSPIVVSQRSGFVTKGHCRLSALKLLNWSKVPVDYQEYESEAQEFADMIADNKIAELADHDDNFMIDSIKELELIDMDFELLGMADFQIDPLSLEVKNTSAELDLDNFDNFEHQCPKCGFEWDNSGKDNS